MKSFLNILIILFTLVTTFSCKDDPVELTQGIDYDVVVTENGVVMNTLRGWKISSEKYGFLELPEALHDSLHIDGLKIKFEFYKGVTFFDDFESEFEIDTITWLREFTFGELISTKPNNSLYTSNWPTIEIIWSPDYSNGNIVYGDGYGYHVVFDSNGNGILQRHFPGVPGLGTFKTETEAFKVAVLIIHKYIQGKSLSTSVSDLDFLKIDWY